MTIIKPHEYPKLFSIVFGEGLMNDAVAIILFKVVGSLLEDSSAIVETLAEEKSTAGIIFGILGGFLANVATSLAIGTAAGTLVLMKRCFAQRFFKNSGFWLIVPFYKWLSYICLES